MAEEITKNGTEPQVESASSLEVLDLDGLILEPPRILLPGGQTVELKDLAREEMVAFLRQVDAIRDAAPDRTVLAWAELIASIAVTPHGNRADVAERLDAMTLPHVALCIQWIRNADAVTFDASEVSVVGRVKLDGVTRDIYPLTVGDYRRLMARVEDSEDLDLAAAFERNLESWAVMMPGVTAERLGQLSQWTRGVLAAKIGEMQSKALTDLMQRGANPTTAPAARRAERRAALSRGRRRG